MEHLSSFAQWVLDTADGKIKPPLSEGKDFGEDDIIVPAQFCDLTNQNSVDNMIESTYTDFMNNWKDPKYLSDRAILTPTNQTVTHLNDLIVEKIPGESFSYYSVDSAEEFGGTDDDLHNAFPIEYLNSISLRGMPSHD